MVSQRRETFPHAPLCVAVADRNEDGDNGNEAEKDGPFNDFTSLAKRVSIESDALRR